MLCMTCCLLDARDVQHVGESSPVDVQQLRENRNVKHEVNVFTYRRNTLNVTVSV